MLKQTFKKYKSKRYIVAGGKAQSKATMKMQDYSNRKIED